MAGCGARASRTRGGLPDVQGSAVERGGGNASRAAEAGCLPSGLWDMPRAQLDRGGACGGGGVPVRDGVPGVSDAVMGTPSTHAGRESMARSARVGSDARVCISDGFAVMMSFICSCS